MSQPLGELPSLDLRFWQRPCAPWPAPLIRLLVAVPVADDALARPHVVADDARPDTRSTLRLESGEIVTVCRGAAEAWALASERELLPHAWSHDTRRCFGDHEVLFLCETCAGVGMTGYNYDDLCASCGGRGREVARRAESAPTSIDALWMVACPALVEEAEALVWTALARLADPPPVARIQWGRVRGGRAFPLLPSVEHSPISQRAALGDLAAHRAALERAPWWPEAMRMGRLTRSMLVSDVAGAWAQRDAGILEGALEPLLRLWELGVVVEERIEDRVVLDRACSRAPVAMWRPHVPIWESVP